MIGKISAISLKLNFININAKHKMATLHQLIKGLRKTKTFRSSTPHFHGAPQKKGTVLRYDIIKPKKPNSAKRKVVKVRLRNGRECMAYIRSCF